MYELCVLRSAVCKLVFSYNTRSAVDCQRDGGVTAVADTDAVVVVVVVVGTKLIFIYSERQTNDVVNVLYNHMRLTHHACPDTKRVR